MPYIENLAKKFLHPEVAPARPGRKPMKKTDDPRLIKVGNTLRANGLTYLVYRQLARGRFLIRSLTGREAERNG